MPGSVMSILNATSPMFGLGLGAAFAGERITARKIAGIVIGAAGVVLVARPAESEAGPMFLWGVAACLCASFAYGMTGVVIKKWGAGVPSRGIAVGAQLAAAVALLPLLPLLPPLAAPSALVAVNLVGLGVLASGIALLLYFRLMADIGATRALTVTFLVPVFGLTWGMLFLGESLTPSGIAGAVLVLAGTLLVTRG
jgi:drug/metabolite transporter (DMT)-like permease